MAKTVKEMQKRIDELREKLPDLSGQVLVDALNEIHSLNKEIRNIQPIYHGGMCPENTRERRIDRRTLDELQKVAARFIEIISNEIEFCESPIERLLGMWIYFWVMVKGIHEDGCFTLNPQHEIKIQTGQVFRVDFCISCKMKGEYISLVVECDGHDYHEKTKEQAQKDKNRDRLLKMAGYEVIHFTGSEIWADPSKCAREVISMLKRLWDNRKVV